ncbi:hypothetical protein [Streptomyces sp. NPDC046870]|uniref:hypothetical protein n=1 Tax=Streptomyces sp. NPDC046870 TaxID=3155135 RepID=UPI0034554101
MYEYINQGHADADRSHNCPRRLARMLLTRPDNLKLHITIFYGPRFSGAGHAWL